MYLKMLSHVKVTFVASTNDFRCWIAGMYHYYRLNIKFHKIMAHLDDTCFLLKHISKSQRERKIMRRKKSQIWICVFFELQVQSKKCEFNYTPYNPLTLYDSLEWHYLPKKKISERWKFPKFQITEKDK